MGCSGCIPFLLGMAGYGCQHPGGGGGGIREPPCLRHRLRRGLHGGSTGGTFPFTPTRMGTPSRWPARSKMRGSFPSAPAPSWPGPLENQGTVRVLAGLRVQGALRNQGLVETVGCQVEAEGDGSITGNPASPPQNRTIKRRTGAPLGDFPPWARLFLCEPYRALFSENK